MASFAISDISGFSDRGLQDALERMRPLFTDRSPFINPPKAAERVQWIRSELVCEVGFAEWTDDEQLRQTYLLRLTG
jgi:bifunctional non-homologous end joining protein LigD